MTQETAAEIYDRYKNDFMTPDIYHGKIVTYESESEGGTQMCPSEYADLITEEERETAEYCTGYIVRLSAGGYMDATDWMGPYSSEKEALDELLDMFPPVNDETEVEGAA